MKSIPVSSAMRASRRQSGQLADQRSGTVVADRPEEQFAPNRPIFSALPLYIARRSDMDDVRASTGVLRGLKLQRIARITSFFPLPRKRGRGQACASEDASLHISVHKQQL